MLPFLACAWRTASSAAQPTASQNGPRYVVRRCAVKSVHTMVLELKRCMIPIRATRSSAATESCSKAVRSARSTITHGFPKPRRTNQPRRRTEAQEAEKDLRPE
eukprot:1668708-Prymnesium_polylepis.1